MGTFDVYIVSKLLEVKVSIVFLVTGCFSQPRNKY